MPDLATLTASISTPAVSVTSHLTFTGEGGAGRLELTGAVTYVLDLAMVPAAGCRGLLVVVDLADAAGVAATAPVTLTWTSNAVSKSEEVSPGGFLALSSPTPAHGVTALSIITTANAVVHAYLLA